MSNPNVPAFPPTIPGDVIRSNIVTKNLVVNGEIFGEGASQPNIVVDTVAIAESTQTPATPATGGILYSQNGELKYIGSSGSVTTIAPA